MARPRNLIGAVAVSLFTTTLLIPAALVWHRSCTISQLIPNKQKTFRNFERPLIVILLFMSIVHVVADYIFAVNPSASIIIGITSVLSFRLVIAGLFCVLELRAMEHTQTLTYIRHKTIPLWINILCYGCLSISVFSIVGLPCINLIVNIDILYPISYLIFVGLALIASISSNIVMLHLLKESRRISHRVRESIDEETIKHNKKRVRRMISLAIIHGIVGLFCVFVLLAFIVPLVRTGEYNVLKKKRVRYPVTPFFTYFIIVLGNGFALVDVWVPRQDVVNATLKLKMISNYSSNTYGYKHSRDGVSSTVTTTGGTNSGSLEVPQHHVRVVSGSLTDLEEK